MLAHGNGTRQQCASNLAKTVRGEVPFERMKGIDRALFDTLTADPNRIRADLSWLIATYEPRITRTVVTVNAKDAMHGGLGVRLEIE